MTPGQYQASLDESKRMLRSLNILKGEQDRKGHLSSAFLDILHVADYRTVYEMAVQHSDYELLLFDDAFLQFTYRRPSRSRVQLRYAFYPSPYYVPSYDEFLMNLDFRPQDVGDELREEYDQVVAEAPLNTAVLPIRYDYSEPSSYEAGIHPISHYHFGWQNESRVGTYYCLTPLAFVLFIIRHIYTSRWRNLLADGRLYKLVLTHKNPCAMVSAAYMCPIDIAQLNLK